MKIIKTFFYLLFSLAIYLNIAQTISYAQGEIEDKDITIEKDINIELPPKTKMYEKITPQVVKFDSPTITYQFDPVDYEGEEIDSTAAAAQDEAPEEIMTIEKFTKGYLRAGVGNYQTTYAEAFYEHKTSPKNYYSLYGKHLSSLRGPIGKEYSAASQHEIRANWNQFLKNSKIDLSLQYQRRMQRFYGYTFQENNPFNEADSMKQVLHLLNFQAGLIDQRVGKKLTYQVKAHYTYWRDRFENQENQIGLRAELDYQWSERLKITTDMQGWLMPYQQNTQTIERTYWSIKPQIDFQIQKFNIRAGFNVINQNDTLNAQDNFLFYPLLQASYRFNDLLMFVAGIEGDLQRTTRAQMSFENPFLRPQIQLFHVNKPFEIYGKIIGKPKPELSYQATISYAQYKNMYFYVNSPADSAKFNPIYAFNESHILRIAGEIAYTGYKKLILRFTTAFNGFILPDNFYAFHRPSLESNLWCTYTPIEKLSLHLDFYFVAGARAINYRTNEILTLNSIADCNLKIEYAALTKWNIFAEINNIFGQNYQRLLHYPQQGLNFIVGVGYDF
ncbi:MAG: hypothetical protein EAZ55_14475 [Cytophagales bacterium]|nr:MAG: hypothetical protein EAZ55_14475 [Cytophagales bacterium]